MNEKVKLTQEQADAITKHVNKGLENSDILYRYLRFDGYDEQFRGLTFGALADALYTGYEVEPEFKVGDWVSTRTSRERIGKVTAVTNGGGIIHIDHKHNSSLTGYKNFVKQNVRHATPEEITKEKRRRWWAKHNRDVYEFKQYDMVRHHCGTWGGLCVVNSDKYSKDAFKNRLVNLYNIKMDGNITIKASDLEVVCFAEDRKDVKKMDKTVIVLEVSNATDVQIQRDLGQAFTDFCNKNKGAGITANVLKDNAGQKVIDYINEEE